LNTYTSTKFGKFVLKRPS